MKRYDNKKDFLHDTNDIILAIVVIAIAIGIIIWRLNIILDYPATIAEQNAQAKQTTQSSQDGN